MNFQFHLSLVMPTYDREKEIQISIKSILDTLPESLFKHEIELVILDNGSDYDIEDALKEIKVLSKNKLSLKIIKNGYNIGNDRNFLKALCEANGRYILQCSDRYYYNIDFSSFLSVLKKENPECIIFSDRFRKYKKTNISLINSYKDAWLNEEFNIVRESVYFYEINRQDLIESHYIKSGLINSFSDLILVNKGKSYFQCKFAKFIDSHMLGVTAQLDCISNSNKIILLRINMNSIVHQNIGMGNLYNRHDYNEVYYGNVLIQENYGFIGTKNEIMLSQIRGLINLYLEDRAGLYCAYIRPDKKLINSAIKENHLRLRWHEKIDLFFLNVSVSSFIIRYYVLLKRLYLLNKKGFKKIKHEQNIVKDLKISVHD